MNYEDANEILNEGTLINGVFRWHSNNRIPPKEILEVLFKAGKLSAEDVAKNISRSEEETAMLIEEYIASRKQRTAEQKAEEAYEMRAAFGEGEKVVDVFTGEVTYT